MLVGRTARAIRKRLLLLLQRCPYARKEPLPFTTQAGPLASPSTQTPCMQHWEEWFSAAALPGKGWAPACTSQDSIVCIGIGRTKKPYRDARGTRSLTSGRVTGLRLFMCGLNSFSGSPCFAIAGTSLGTNTHPDKLVILTTCHTHTPALQHSTTSLSLQGCMEVPHMGRSSK